MQTDFVIQRDTYSLQASLTYKEGANLKGYLLYFHGGGLLFGNKNDLPKQVVDFYTGNGFGIVSFDYGLAPYTKLPGILTDLKDGVFWFLEHQELFPVPKLPWYLWGRSAGAYLCLIGTLLKVIPYPTGILSYYGYGFLEPDWFQLPNAYYNRFPACASSALDTVSHDRLSGEICTCGSLQTHYSSYVHARQTGTWVSLFYDGKMKDFLREYTFLLHEVPDDFPPVFLTHALQDPDVPYGESKALHEKISNSVFYPVSGSEHDFDRNSNSYATRRLLELSGEFLEETGSF